MKLYTQILTACFDCPHFHQLWADGDGWCEHPTQTRRTKDAPSSIPDWCPLPDAPTTKEQGND
jgi:hypothetical protein